MVLGETVSDGAMLGIGGSLIGVVLISTTNLSLNARDTNAAPIPRIADESVATIMRTSCHG